MAIAIFPLIINNRAGRFERTQENVLEKAPDIEETLRVSVFHILDENVKQIFRAITIADLVNEAEKHQENVAIMF